MTATPALFARMLRGFVREAERTSRELSPAERAIFEAHVTPDVLAAILAAADRVEAVQ